VSHLDNSLRGGHYARKQIYCKDWLISWSHRRRYQVGLKLTRQLSASRILDYGCGDGTFLAMLAADSTASLSAVGAEMYTSLVEDCNARLGRAGLRFVLSDELDAPEHVNAYDLVSCMEVLEHIPNVEGLLDRFRRLLVPSGVLLISVPVEIGPVLIIKQMIRTIAGWRGLGDYPGTSSYSLREYLASVFAGPRQHIERPIHRDSDGQSFHDHKGFNWRVLRDAVARRFAIERTLSSPFVSLPPHLATQVWFVARKRGPSLS
jgi:SAM-dependent methyltransferase